jgi:hypothetical protein
MTGAAPAVTVRDGALDVGGRRVPLLAGEVQFWRMAPGRWGPVLDAAAAAGIRIVSSYLSWRRHEPEPGRFVWDGRLDAAAFVRACADRGLLVQLKPGPWICAEEPGGGYPDWLLARTGDLALDAAGESVRGYNPPFVHPVPSVHAPGYLAAARGWFAAVWAQLGDLAYPDGPVVAVQLDNEPGYAFQDALFVADYHPAAVAAFRAWLAARYAGDDEHWRAAWGLSTGRLAEAEPPRPPRPPRPTSAPFHPAVADWVAFTRDAIVGHLRALWQMHDELGFGRLLPTVNLINHPVHDEPVPHAAVRAGLGGRAAVGVDHYYEPPVGWADVNRLALTAATARAAGEPCVWAPELMAGIWRSPGEAVGYPDPTPDEQAAWWGAALALGYQGANLYMLADRENWALAPIDEAGRPGSLLRHVRALTGLADAAPDVLRGTPRTVVSLVWDDEDTRAAYAATGTARHPEVPWGRPDDLVAYREALRIGTELLAAGFAYELWHPRRGAAPAPGTTLVVSAASRWARDGGHGCLVVGVGQPVAAALGTLRPPARIEPAGAADAGGVAVVHDTPVGTLLHVARWAAGPGDLVVPPMGDRAPGRWVPAAGAGDPLVAAGPGRWRLPDEGPHLVLRWQEEPRR